MTYNNILTLFSSDIVHKVEHITYLIKTSVEYSHQYFAYISSSTVLKSESEDDWHFCILVLKFIRSESDFDEILVILKYFLYRDRYRNKLIDHHTYLIKTIKKVISYSLEHNLVGSYLKNQINKNNIILNSNLDIKTLKSCRSISKSNVLKMCNLFNFFYLNNSKSSSCKLVLDCSTSNNNFMKVNLHNGILNHFDLTILISILHQYNQLLLPSDTFKLHVPSVLKVVGYDTGYSRKKFLNSLQKLSMTSLHCRKQYLRFKSDSMQHSEDHFYSFCGNLLSFENLSTSKLTALNVQLSLPLIRMVESNKYYALINWHSFVGLPNNKLRLLYFYFCLNVKVSCYFTEFKVCHLVKNLYFDSEKSSNPRVYAKDVRHLLLFFVNDKKHCIDFEFNPIFKKSSSIIQAIKVRRSKLITI
nr:hypothetical protein [Gracilaria tikvahiae]